ncbi:hypothetical protein IMCC3317_22460 [Kordia antarctica]|uniref:Uncharacterized protein n=1 Tax=Kordia antarctica TaxID=1218801 RepID=A0A7L4ZKX3_9FLAO|nr:hypothetical protein [Kordia antarctica]QHI36876.1 hypothetical protein IMCC3317_22460 [Kordia antarctica]
MKKLLLTAVTLSLVFATSCDVKQTQETVLPDVDVTVEEGQLPSFDVEWADIDVGMKTTTVTVPKVVVVMEEVEVEVPYIDVDMPDEFGEKEERTILVEAEVDGVEHNIKIKKIYASKNNLIVVSELVKGSTTLGDKKLRVSDQITLNAPDLNVKHYIVGERPNRLYNGAYKYYSSMSALKSKVDGYKEIYSK